MQAQAGTRSSGGQAAATGAGLKMGSVREPGGGRQASDLTVATCTMLTKEEMISGAFGMGVALLLGEGSVWV